MEKKKVAEGPIKSELKNIIEARSAYRKTSHGKMMHFINAYNLRNKHSINGYACGLHCDYYQKGCESFENKILMINENISQSVGRGGSLHGGKYVFAILDWGAAKKVGGNGMFCSGKHFNKILLWKD